MEAHIRLRRDPWRCLRNHRWYRGFEPRGQQDAGKCLNSWPSLQSLTRTLDRDSPGAGLAGKQGSPNLPYHGGPHRPLFTPFIPSCWTGPSFLPALTQSHRKSQTLATESSWRRCTSPCSALMSSLAGFYLLQGHRAVEVRV